MTLGQECCIGVRGLVRSLAILTILYEKLSSTRVTTSSKADGVIMVGCSKPKGRANTATKQGSCSSG
jgi:hypothetical protein